MNGEPVRRDRAANRICAAIACAWLLLAAACAPSLGGQPLAGSFLADNRPHELIYLDLNATGPAVAGILTLVTVDDELGTQVDTFDVRGWADPERATLVAERFLGRPDATLTLARAGRGVTLTMPSFTGDSIALPLQPASQGELNQRIGEWSAEITTARRDRAADAARAIALRRQADDLARTLADVRLSARRLQDVAADARAAQLDEQIRVQRLAGYVLQLKRDAAADGEDQGARCSSTRYRRQVGDRVSLEGVFADQRSRLSEAIDRLDAGLVAGRRQSAQARERARLFEDASNAVATLPPLAVFRGDEVQTLEAYATTAEQARRDLDRLKVSDKELRDRAQELIGEGRGLLNAAPDDADCRPAAPSDE